MVQHKQKYIQNKTIK